MGNYQNFLFIARLLENLFIVK